MKSSNKPQVAECFAAAALFALHLCAMYFARAHAGSFGSELSMFGGGEWSALGKIPAESAALLCLSDCALPVCAAAVRRAVLGRLPLSHPVWKLLLLHGTVVLMWILPLCSYALCGAFTAAAAMCIAVLHAGAPAEDSFSAAAKRFGEHMVYFRDYSGYDEHGNKKDFVERRDEYLEKEWQRYLRHERHKSDPRLVVALAIAAVVGVLIPFGFASALSLPGTFPGKELVSTTVGTLFAMGCFVAVAALFRFGFGTAPCRFGTREWVAYNFTALTCALLFSVYSILPLLSAWLLGKYIMTLKPAGAPAEIPSPEAEAAPEKPVFVEPAPAGLAPEALSGEPAVPRKNLPDELRPGVPIAGAGSEAPAVQTEEPAPHDERPKPEKPKSKPTKAQDAYGTAALLSLLLLVVCFFFSLDFLKGIFLFHKEDHAYVPPEGFEFFGTAPLPVLLMYALFAVGLPVLIALFARFVCAKMPLDPITKIWGIYFVYYFAVALVSLEVQSHFIALLCGIFFIVCFYIFAHDKAKKPRNFSEFAEYSSDLAARAVAKIEE